MRNDDPNERKEREMKHVKSTTRQVPVKAVVDPYQQKKDFVFGPLCPDGTFTKPTR